MIKSITIINPYNESLNITLTNPYESGFAVYDISGLGPGKANVNVSSIATDDGGMFNFARLDPRNIVFKFKLVEEPLYYSIEGTRHLSYKYFPLKKEITMIFETDRRKSYIKGIVESNEPDIFSNSEMIQVSVICPDPFFYAYGDGGEQVTLFRGAIPMFEFPFKNDGLNTPTLKMGDLVMMDEQTVYYEGDADVGMLIRLKFLDHVRNITIHNSRTREKFKIDTDLVRTITGSEIETGDYIEISTIKGRKSATIVKTETGIRYNILNAIPIGSSWFVLHKGDNVFSYEAEEGGSFIQFEIINKIVYEGV